MRLLYVAKGGVCTLKSFNNDKTPCYAILSHTWGDESSEISHQSVISNGLAKNGPINGSHKLRFLRHRVEVDGLKYFWIDTCCIDKSNSSELLESLNSMYKWYQHSTKCYVILSDVTVDKSIPLSNQPWDDQFRQSKWFTRGWTLQELVAPKIVEFYSWNGVYLGNKQSLETLIHGITKIPKALLRGAPLSRYPLDERMSWAAGRQTKRPEDQAYCMTGICGVFLPFMYGWGEAHAVTELRQKVDQIKPKQKVTADRVVRIGKASYNDLLALNDTQLASLETQLLQVIYDIKDLGSNWGLASPDYGERCYKVYSQVFLIFKKFKVDFDVDSRHDSRVKEGSYALLTSNHVLAWRWGSKEAENYNSLCQSLEGNAAIKTCIDVLVWRGTLTIKD